MWVIWLVVPEDVSKILSPECELTEYGTRNVYKLWCQDFEIPFSCMDNEASWRHGLQIDWIMSTDFLIVRFQGYFSGREWKFPLSAGNKTKTRTKLFWNSVVNKFKTQISKIFILIHLYCPLITHCLSHLQPQNLFRNSHRYCQLKQLFFHLGFPKSTSLSTAHIYDTVSSPLHTPLKCLRTLNISGCLLSVLWNILV
jgi:hypothetical protein